MRSCVRSLLMESDDEDWEDIISSMGQPRTLEFSDENLNFCDEDERQKSKSVLEALCGSVGDSDS